MKFEIKLFLVFNSVKTHVHQAFLLPIIMLLGERSHRSSIDLLKSYLRFRNYFICSQRSLFSLHTIVLGVSMNFMNLSIFTLSAVGYITGIFKALFVNSKRLKDINIVFNNNHSNEEFIKCTV